MIYIHNVVFDFYKEFLHGENVFSDVERAHRDEKCGIVETDQFAKDLPS